MRGAVGDDVEAAGARRGVRGERARGDDQPVRVIVDVREADAVGGAGAKHAQAAGAARFEHVGQEEVVARAVHLVRRHGHGGQPAAAARQRRPVGGAQRELALGLGLGVRLQQLTLLRFFAPVLLTSASVSCVGSLGFVGLMAPHMARFLLRGGQVALLCGSALVGALLVLATDTIGRLAFAPLQIPAGIVIALVGCPFFIVLLWRRRDAL